MKFHYLILITLLFGCANNKSDVTIVTFDDEKTKSIRSHYQNYLDNNIEGLKSLWSPNLKIYLTDTKQSGVEDISNLIIAQHKCFSEIPSFLEDAIIETKTYPNGNTWTSSWFIWKATSSVSGNTISIPVHIGFKWGEGNKIVEEYHMYNTKLMEEELALCSGAI